VKTLGGLSRRSQARDALMSALQQAAVQVHQTKYLLDIGFPPPRAAAALGFVEFTGVSGQIALGYLSDRLGWE